MRKDNEQSKKNKKLIIIIASIILCLIIGVVCWALIPKGEDEGNTPPGQEQVVPGNQGSGNQGSGNQNSGNQDSGNQDSGNQDSGNQDSGNQDSGNQNQETHVTYVPTSQKHVNIITGYDPISLVYTVGDTLPDGSVFKEEDMTFIFYSDGKVYIKIYEKELTTTWSKTGNNVTIVGFEEAFGSPDNAVYSFYFEENEDKFIFKVVSSTVDGGISYVVETYINFVKTAA